jgi:hypothetical protein
VAYPRVATFATQSGQLSAGTSLHFTPMPPPTALHAISGPSRILRLHVVTVCGEGLFGSLQEP